MTESTGVNPDSPPDVRHEERRFQIRITVIAAGAGVVGALIGVLGSYVATGQQVNAQTDALHQQSLQARNDYLRDQRRGAYAAFLRDEQVLYDLALNLSKAATVDTFPLKGLLQRLRAVQSQVSAVGRDHANVQVIGSPEVLIPAQKLYEAALYFAVDSVTLASTGTLDKRKDLDRQSKRVPLVRQTFILAARDSLGVADDADDADD